MKLKTWYITLLFLSYFYLFLVNSSDIVFAQYSWPANEKEIIAISSEFKENKSYMLIEYTGEIKSVSSGVVQVVRSANTIDTLPGLIKIISHDNVSISYIYIHPIVVVGDIVQTGDVIGYANDTMYLGMLDLERNIAVDPLLILPDIERELSIRLEDMSFIYKNPDETMELQRRLRSGNVELQLTLSVRDHEQYNYILPYMIWVEIAGVEYVISIEDILSLDSKSSILSNNMVRIVLPDVLIPHGYFDIFIKVKSPLKGFRSFKFNVFAYLPKNISQ